MCAAWLMVIIATAAAAHPDPISYNERQDQSAGEWTTRIYVLGFICCCVLSACGIYFGLRDKDKPTTTPRDEVRKSGEP